MDQGERHLASTIGPNIMTDVSDVEMPIENTEQDEEIYVDYDIATYPSDNTLSVLK